MNCVDEIKREFKYIDEIKKSGGQLSKNKFNVVRANSKSPSCGGSLGCRDDRATKNTSTMHERCIGQDKDQGDDGHLSKVAAARDH